MPPKIGEASEIVEIRENETTTIDCPVDTDDAEIRWSKNGVPISSSAHLQVRVFLLC